MFKKEVHKKNKVSIKASAARAFRNSFCDFLKGNDPNLYVDAVESGANEIGDSAKKDTLSLVNQILPKQKDGIASMAITSTRKNQVINGTLIFVDSVPVLIKFELPGRNGEVVIPVLNVLHQLKTPILPTLLVHPSTLSFLFNGSDLKLPGVCNFAQCPDFEMFTLFQVCAVQSGDRVSQPMALVFSERRKSDYKLEERDNRFLNVLSLGDSVWMEVPQRLRLQLEEAKSHAGVNSCGNSASVDLLAESQTAKVDADILCSQLSDLDVGPDAMEEHCRWSILQALSSVLHGKDMEKVFPITSSQLFDTYMQVCRPIPQRLNIKKSKSKKLAKFLREFIDNGLLLAKVNRSGADTLILAFDSGHPQLVSFYPASKAKLAKMQASSLAEAAAEPQRQQQEKVQDSFHVRNFYQLRPTSMDYLRDFLPKDVSDGLFSLEHVQGALEELYKHHSAQLEFGSVVKKGGVSEPAVGGLLNLHDGLKRLLKSREVRDDALLGKSFILERVLNQMKPCYKFCTRNSREGSCVQVVWGKFTPIHIWTKRRGGNKLVTHVANWHHFFVDVEEAAADLRKALATAVSLDKEEMLLNINGDVAYEVCCWLKDSLGIELPKGLTVNAGTDGKKKTLSESAKRLFSTCPYIKLSPLK